MEDSYLQVGTQNISSTRLNVINTFEVIRMCGKTLSTGRRHLGDVLQTGIELKSLILAQIERWRNALHMQVERQRGATWRRAANG